MRGTDRRPGELEQHKTKLTRLGEQAMPPEDPAESGAEESRTPDLFIANEALYQLSYRPGCRLTR
jgi:hypothetical protein